MRTSASFFALLHTTFKKSSARVFWFAHCFIGAGDDIGIKTVDEKLPVPTVASRFTPDDVHLIVSAELVQATAKPPGYIYRQHRIRIFKAERRAILIKEWKIGRSKAPNQHACDTEFLFPRDESTGRRK